MFLLNLRVHNSLICCLFEEDYLKVYTFKSTKDMHNTFANAYKRFDDKIFKEEFFYNRDPKFELEIETGDICLINNTCIIRLSIR